MTIEDKVEVAISTAKIYKQIWEDIFVELIKQFTDSKIIYIKCDHPEVESCESQSADYKSWSHYLQCKKCRVHGLNHDFGFMVEAHGRKYYFTRDEYEFVSKGINSVMDVPNRMVSLRL